MATLADEFMNDLLDDEDDAGIEEDSQNVSEEDKKEGVDGSALLGSAPAVYKAVDVKQVSHWLTSPELRRILAEIKRYQEMRKESLEQGDPEFDLIVRCNEVAVELSETIADVWKFARDIYSKRFPELESLVLHAIDYAKTVLVVQNDLTAVQSKLVDILPASNILTISMAATSSVGKDLPETELAKCIEACNSILKLDGWRQEILDYVAGRMQFYAPNLSALVGTEIAAKLIGAAGGLGALANMPSSTLHVLGKKKRTLDGFSSATAIKHPGYIKDCQIIRDTPVDLETKACRLVANKCTLVARMDLQHDNFLKGEHGARLREEVYEKIAKWQAPPPRRKIKLVPRPDRNEGRTKRGGQKLRRHKEKFQVSELRRRAGRIKFGEVQEEYGNTMKTLGTVGSVDGSGILRATAAEEGNFKIKAKDWKRHGRKGKEHQPGFATSVFAYDTAQGMELIDPNANKEKLEEEAQSYFSSNSSFINIKK